MIRTSTLFLIALSSTAYAAPTLSITGTCPGSVQFDTAALTPGGTHAYVSANVAGTANYPIGPCTAANSNLSPSGMTLQGTAPASGAGTASIAQVLSAGACGLYVSVLDVATCEVSPAARIPTPIRSQFGGPVDGAQSVPSNGSTAAGLVTASVDGADNMDFTVDVHDFTNTMTASHFHNAAAGSTGGVLLNVASDLTQTSTEVVGAGTWAMSASERTELDGERVYLNLHSNVFGGGEVRGQLVPATLLSGGIDGDQSVPVVASPASGTVRVAVDAGGVATWTIEVTGLSNTLTAAHFHGAAGGMSGGVLHNISGDLTQAGSTVVGSGSWTPSAGDLADLLAGDVYVNLHTNVHGGGEIRGQILTD